MKALTKQEREILSNYFKTSPVKLIRLKSQAILMRDSGFSQEQTGIALLRETRSIQRWESDFNDRRLASMFSGHVGNENAAKLTRNQKEDIKKVLQQAPSEAGLPVSFWDVPELKEYVKAEFGVRYESAKSYHYLLHFSDLSFKYPDKFDKKRDEEAIKKRMEEIYRKITPLLGSDEWEVLCADEVGLQLNQLTRKAWLKKGEKTVVKVERMRERQNFMGYLNQKSGRCHIFPINSGNSEEMIRTLRLITKKYPRKKICIIWDNATCHKSKELKAELAKGKSLEHIHLIALPPYAPDHNPIEMVWNEGKRKAVKFIDVSLEKVTSLFLRHIAHSIYDYRI